MVMIRVPLSPFNKDAVIRYIESGALRYLAPFLEDADIYVEPIIENTRRVMKDPETCHENIYSGQDGDLCVSIEMPTEDYERYQMYNRELLGVALDAALQKIGIQGVCIIGLLHKKKKDGKDHPITNLEIDLPDVE